MRKLIVAYLQYRYPEGRGPGWYWWFDRKEPVQHGPFSNEVLCRRDLARINNAGEQVVPRTVFKRLAELLAERNIDIEKLLPKVEAAGKEGS